MSVFRLVRARDGEECDAESFDESGGGQPAREGQQADGNRHQSGDDRLRNTYAW